MLLFVIFYKIILNQINVNYLRHANFCSYVVGNGDFRGNKQKQSRTKQSKNKKIPNNNNNNNNNKKFPTF